MLIWSYDRCIELCFSLWILPDSNNYNVKWQNLKHNEGETRYMWEQGSPVMTNTWGWKSSEVGPWMGGRAVVCRLSTAFCWGRQHGNDLRFPSRGWRRALIDCLRLKLLKHVMKMQWCESFFFFCCRILYFKIAPVLHYNTNYELYCNKINRFSNISSGKRHDNCQYLTLMPVILHLMSRFNASFSRGDLRRSRPTCKGTFCFAEHLWND